MTLSTPGAFDGFTSRGPIRASPPVVLLVFLLRYDPGFSQVIDLDCSPGD